MIYAKVFVTNPERLEDALTEWLDFMQDDGDDVVITHATQSQDGETVTLVLFCDE